MVPSAGREPILQEGATTSGPAGLVSLPQHEQAMRWSPLA